MSKPQYPGAQNLMKVYRACHPEDRADAMNSYFRYRDICQAIATNHEAELHTVAAVFSALSPNNDYIGNIKDAISVMAFSKGRIRTPKVHTYRQNLRKALKIASTELHPNDAFQALKTKNFYRNIICPEDTGHVTVDGHMVNAFRGDRKGNVKGLRFNDREYEEIKDIIIGLAQALDIIPNQFQAICWVSWKAMNGRKYSQPEFFPLDLWLAGLSPAWRRQVGVFAKPDVAP